jgi:hypothetical protein
LSRKSRDDFGVVVGNLGQRPEPPEDLTPAQSQVWRSTVASESSDFFRTSALRDLLRDYCCHRADADALTKQINLYDLDTAMDPDAIKAVGKLLMFRDREAKGAADKATKLRLTNQSRYTPQAASTAAKNASTQRKPWEVGA